MSSRRTALVLVAAVAACGGGPPRAKPAAAETKPVVAPAKGGSAASEPAAAASATNSSATAAAPAAETWTDLEASSSAPELEPGVRAIRASDWTGARKELMAGLEKIRGSAPLDEVLAGQVLLARVCLALADAKCAEDAYGAVVAAWKGSETAKQVLEGGGSDEAARALRLHRALLAVGEALYFQAEQKRRAADRVVMPAYAGDATKDAIRAHLDTKVKPWAEKKQRLVEEAEAAYAKIAALEPPPPRWVVDASARVGMTWGKFVAEFRAAPIPSAWKRDGETQAKIRAAYYEALDTESQPQRRRAREALQKCSSEAAKLGYKDELSRSCEAWLEKSR